LSSPDQYGDIAAIYAEAEALPLRADVEFPTFRAALGPVAGAEVLDLACGTGVYSRLMVAAGARRVVGVDSSGPMIDIARARLSPGSPIEFLVHDAGTMPDVGQFDIVVAVFLLNYARTAEELGSLCRTVARHLRPGGRFVGALPNSDHDPARLDSRYGVTYGWQPGAADGDTFTFKLQLSQLLEIECVYWRLETYRQALTTAGLRNVEFRPWRPTDDAVARRGADYWQPWLNSPVCVVVTADAPPR
jgi:SAM-dependent methyltransferase